MTCSHSPSQKHYSIVQFLLSGSLLLAVQLTICHAQVKTVLKPDTSLGTDVKRNGSTYTITGGMRPDHGPNLFQSFDRFQVGTGDTARFRSPAGVEKFLSRVTGGQASVIDGVLQSKRPGVHLYLLNPSGVMFGPHASLDVNGSFHVSTADYLRLADKTTFSAHLGGQSTFTVAPPAAFGFFRVRAAPIALQGSELQGAPGHTVSVVGGEIAITGNPALTSQRIPTLSALGGQIRLVSAMSAGEVALTPGGQPPSPGVESFARLGTIAIRDALMTTSSSAGGGTVVIRGGRVLVNNASLASDTLGDRDGAARGIDIAVRKDIVTQGSLIRTDTLGAGDAGDIHIRAGRLHLQDNSALVSRTSGRGRGGTLRVTATDTLTLSGGSSLFAAALGTATGAGDAGSIVVQAPHIALTGGAQISSGTIGPGRGGTVTVTAADTLTLRGTSPDGVFSSTIATVAQGKSGDAGDAEAVEVVARTVQITGGALDRQHHVWAGPGGDRDCKCRGHADPAGDDSGMVPVPAAFPYRPRARQRKRGMRGWSWSPRTTCRLQAGLRSAAVRLGRAREGQ